MRNVRVVYFGISALFLLGVVVQFFLAGLGAFGATGFDAHQALGLILAVISVVMLVLALAGRLPRLVVLFTIALVAVNALQIVLANVDVEEVAALHTVNALVVFFVAYELMQRSRRYLASKIAA